MLTFHKVSYRRLLNYKRLGIIFLVGLLAVTATPLVGQKMHNDQIEVAQPDASLVYKSKLSSLPIFGQTFVSRQAGLRAIQLPIGATEASDEGTFVLHLRHSSEAVEDIRTASLSLATIQGGKGLAHFSFAPLPGSFNQRYYFFVEPVLGNDDPLIQLRYGGPDSYLDGALYIYGEPQEAQASFVLAYDRGLILLDWITWLINSGPRFLILIMLAVLPGGALLTWVWPKTLAGVVAQNERLNHIEWLALAAGLSIGLYPILLLLAELIGLSLGLYATASIIGLSGLAIVAGVYHRGWIGSDFFGSPYNLGYSFRSIFSLPTMLFWVIFLFSAAVRIFVARGLDIPLWGDSYHHTMISQLIVDNGGLFSSWAPYVPIKSFSYHFGFHAAVAAYHWLAGNDIFQDVIIVGQLANLLTVLVAFLLGRRLGGSDWVGVFAALITGLISEHPMYYMNWGRYTQLTGQVILPVVMVLTLFALNQKKLNLRLVSLISIGLAGLALTHYRVLLFYPCFVLPLLGYKILQVKWKFDALRNYLVSLAVVVIGSIVIISPWFWKVINSRLWNLAYNLATLKPDSRYVVEITAAHLSIFDYLSPLIVILGIAGVVWGSWKRQPNIMITAIWGIILILIANPYFIYLPGTGVITYFAVLIASYLVFSILVGYLFAEVIRVLEPLSPVAKLVVITAVFAVGIVGARERIQAIEPRNALVRAPDLAAMAWIRNNVQPEATFWINTQLAYVNLITGSDAGWWIPLVAQRRSLVLPILYATEIVEPENYGLQVYELYREISQDSFASARIRQQLKKAGVTHIYVGQQQGQAGGGVGHAIDPSILQNSPFYQLLYHQDRVWVFSLN